MGILFFILNAAFAFVLLIMMLVATGYAVFSKNPDVRYQPMRDDRGSFIKSQTNLNTELDALGATARGEGKVPYKPREIDEESFSSHSYDGHGAGYNKEMPNMTQTHANSSYESSPYARAPGPRAPSTRSDDSRNRNNGSPWQKGAGFD